MLWTVLRRKTLTLPAVREASLEIAEVSRIGESEGLEWDRRLGQRHGLGKRDPDKGRQTTFDAFDGVLESLF